MPRSDTAVDLRAVVCVLAVAWASPAHADAAAETFAREVAPILEEHCAECHTGGSDRGGVSFDGIAAPERLRDGKLWWRVLKNARAGLMPPASAEDPLRPAEVEALSRWVKRHALGLDPANPDPGRVTLRRLNRVEYRNTVRALTGVDFDADQELPADDTGYGFDNIADVLTVSPMLLEKYLDAAQTIVARAVPASGRVVATATYAGRAFETLAANTTTPDPALARPTPKREGEALDLSFYTPATVGLPFRARHAGTYQLTLDVRPVERFTDASDLNRCRLTVKSDGEVLHQREIVRDVDARYELTFDRALLAGEHTLTVEIEPVTPAQPQLRNLRVRLVAATIRGPLEPRFWVEPENHRRFFPRPVPKGRDGRRRYARELLTRFASRAFRRPVDRETVDALVAIAEPIAAQPNGTFEAGIAQAMVAVLASPRFIFREEEVEPRGPGQAHPFVDEFALASRLSYFLWSSMPDDELFALARRHQLRARLDAQLARMLADPRAGELVRNFTGQWLQARDVADVPINANDVFLRDNPNPAVDAARATFRRLRRIPEDKQTDADRAELAAARDAFFAFSRQPKPQLGDKLRSAMREETERTFAYVLHEDRPVTELIESGYVFVNEELAKHYGLDGVTGPELRKVTLPEASVRGGVLTQGTVLAVTSNPTRTSPVKRGVFILDAILGTPPPPPPPNIPALEDAAPAAKLRHTTLRETLALHASNKTCASCHMRMDPLGLALENFNALGAWRTKDAGQPIEPAGRLATGESFCDVRELKHVLVTTRRRDFYRTLTEKLMTYALGRGVEPSDVDTVDALVAALESSGGKPSALLRGIVRSAPFQQRRHDAASVAWSARTEESPR